MEFEDTSSKVMLAIDGVGFDWSDISEEQVQTNITLMAFSDSEFEKVKQEKKGIEFKFEKFDKASKDLDQLLWSQITDKSKKGLGYSAVPPPHLLIYNRPKKLDLSYSGLDKFKEPEFKGFGSEDKQVSKDTSSFVESSLKVDKETIFSVDKKVESVKPKNHEKPVKKSVRYAEMYRSQTLRGNQRNWNVKKSNQLGSDFMIYNKACFICGIFNRVHAQCKYHQREGMVYGDTYKRVNYNYTTNRTHPNAQRNMVPRAVLMKTGLKTFNTARTVNTAHPKSTVFSAKPILRFSKTAQSTVRRPFQAKTVLTNKRFTQKVNTAKAQAVNTARPKVVKTARPNSAVVNVVRVNQANAGKPQQDDTGFVDSGCSRHMTGNIAYLSDFKEFDGGYVTFGGGAHGGRISKLVEEKLMHVKRGRDTKIPQSSGPPVKVGDEAVHKELGVRMKRAATTISSLEAEQDSGSGPRCQDTILGDVDAQTRFETTSKQSIDPPLLRGYTLIRYALTVNPTIYTSCIQQFWAIAKAKTVNGERQIQALIDKRKVIITEMSIRSDLHLEDAGEETVQEETEEDTAVTQEETQPDDSVPTPSNDPPLSGEDSKQLSKLMLLCTNLQKQVLDLEKAKDARANEIVDLKKRVQKLERKKKSRTTGLKRLRKFGMARRVESSEDKDSLGDHEDASKQGRSIKDIDKDADVSLVDDTQGRSDDAEMFDINDLHGDEIVVDMPVGEKQKQSPKERDVNTAVEDSAAPTIKVSTADEGVTAAKIDELTLAQTLIEIKAAKPKVVTIAAKITKTIRPKARGVVVQEPNQVALDEDLARNLQAQLEDNTQAIMDADFKLAQKLQTEEQGEISIEEISRLFVELMNKRKKHFAMLRAEKKRRKPQTKAKKRNQMSIYFKNMGGYKHNQFKSKSYEEIQKMFDNEIRRVNTFIPIDSEVVKSQKGTEESSKGTEDELKSDKSKKAKSSEEKAKGSRKKMLGKKRAGKEQQQESSKRQRMEDDKEADEHEEVKEDDEAELKKHLVIVKDDEITINAIPLATKPPVIVEYKLLKEGIMVHYQLIRADRSSKIYSSMIRMLQDIDREDLQTLWKLVKIKHGDIRPEDEHERVLYEDLKDMFEPDIRSEVWRNLQGYTVTVWKYMIHVECTLYGLDIGSGSGVTTNSVNGFVPSVTANGVETSVPAVMVNGVVANGVGGSVAQVMNDGVSRSVFEVVVNGVSRSVAWVEAYAVIANDVGGSAAHGMTNGASGSVSEVGVNGVSRLKMLETRLEMERHPKDHTCQSAAMLHELLNDMENLRME
ncbi:hypothetical protein Tco_0128663 [Tanacetum coccineum]